MDIDSKPRVKIKMAQFSDVFVFFVASLHVAVTLMVFTEVDKTQPSPYMDEIFHIPQAQKYCNGSFGEVHSSSQSHML